MVKPKTLAPVLADFLGRSAGQAGDRPAAPGADLALGGSVFSAGPPL
jgi:hypothetical protein